MMTARQLGFAALGLALGALGGCGGGSDDAADTPRYDGHGVVGIVALGTGDLSGRESLPISSPRPFVRVGLRWDGGGAALEARAATTDGAFSEWTPVALHWREENLAVGDWAPPDVGAGGEGAAGEDDAGAQRSAPGLARLELRGLGGLQHLAVDLLEAPRPTPGVAGPPRGFALSSPLDGALDLALGEHTGALAPPGVALPRSAWALGGSRCAASAPEAPSRVAIHHTVTPNPDRAPPGRRLRQLQAYHMLVNGACDLGYHFVVDAAGRVWQTRDERNGGAHLPGAPAGTVGVAFLGDFEAQPPTTVALTSAAHLLAWLRGAHGLSLTRARVRGHAEHHGAFDACPGAALTGQLDALVALAATVDPSATPMPPCDEACAGHCATPPCGEGSADGARCPAADGQYCGSEIGGRAEVLYACDGAAARREATCSAGCTARGDGNSACGAPPATGCADVEGRTCGASLNLDPGAVYDCVDEALVVVESCPEACRDGACVAGPVEGSACPNGDGPYCGEPPHQTEGALYRCIDGVYIEIEQCDDGCVGPPAQARCSGQ